MKNEEEFLKEHPSLKGKICTPVGDMQEYSDSNQPIECHYVDLEQLHKTQLDKQIVNDVIGKIHKRLLAAKDQDLHTDSRNMNAGGLGVIEEVIRELKLPRRS